jgi:hypothetical protein
VRLAVELAFLVESAKRFSPLDSPIRPASSALGLLIRILFGHVRNSHFPVIFPEMKSRTKLSREEDFIS